MDQTVVDSDDAFPPEGDDNVAEPVLIFLTSLGCFHPPPCVAVSCQKVDSRREIQLDSHEVERMMNRRKTVVSFEAFGEAVADVDD